MLRFIKYHAPLFLGIILGLILAISLTSCRGTQKLKETKTEETKTQTNTESVTTSTITESFKEPVTILPDSVSKDFSINIFDNEPETFEVENESMIVKVKVEDGKIKLSGKTKPKTIDLPGERTIVKHEAKKEVKKEESKKEEVKKEVHKEPLINLNYLWWLVLLIPLYLVLRKKLPFLP